MIAHVILFRPKPGLAAAEREALVAAFERALNEIPGIRRATVGERARLGREYDLRNPQEFPFAAFIEFTTAADLRAYLEHPAHQELGRLFYHTADAAMAFDFELLEGKEVRRLLAQKPLE